ncbi:MAG: thiamine phosphate synthase [Coprococcus sp.]
MNRSDLILYAVTDRAWLNGRTLTEDVEKALKGGATMVQLREKEMAQEDFIAEAREIKKLTDRFGVPLIINDNIEVCLAVDASGVHVGQNDMAAGDVRAKIGPDKILGVTAKTVEQARAAQSAGADYLGSGAIFGSTTKKDARSMTEERLKEIAASVEIPVVAIGGIDADNVIRLVHLGLAGAAIVSGIFSQPDIEAAARRLRPLCEAVSRD